MSRISFYPGPSRVNARVPEYFYDGYMEGILSVNHRSEEFMKLFKKTKKLLKQKLEIPDFYEVIFTSSATECWEIIAQSLTARESFHLFNGAFGAKWCESAAKLGVEVSANSFDIEEELPVKDLLISKKTDVICVTHNETSNGTMVGEMELTLLRKQYPAQLIAVDATSSMAAVSLPVAAADVWFASVQKGFGLPAGLGIMLLSPKALEVAEKIGEDNHYNSLLFAVKNSRQNQTPYTPNVLAIYLLYRVLQDRKTITDVERKVQGRYNEWIDFLDRFDSWKHLVGNRNVRSPTVIPLQAAADVVIDLKKKAENAGFIIGNGYGEWKGSTVRIANFPSIKKKEIESFRSFLKKNFE